MAASEEESRSKTAPEGTFPAGWQPRSDPQRRTLLCDSELVFFGGAAGSLKSETLLVDAARECRHPRLRAILFRRSYPELDKTLIRRSRELYPGLGGHYHEERRCWRFRSGASVEFAYCETDDDIFRYQGAEYSFIGFDESTHFNEFPIRYMLSRLRSTGAGLKLRMRLASNPGNIGHHFHKAVFLGDGCAHCDSARDRVEPGLYRRVAVWPSDGRPLPTPACFIPGTIYDHALLNRDYLAALEGLPGAFRRALLEGCWDVYEGQYFDIWNPLRMTVPRAAIREQPWWPHWIGADYGFNGSQAAAYLFCKSPATDDFPHGRTYVLDEYIASHQKASDFAVAVARRWLASADDSDRRQDRRIQGWYLSPDAWSQRGDDHSLAEQMRAAARIMFTPASTDRVGGAMLIYTQLDSGELVIADTCRQLIGAIPSRIHDPDRPDDLLKVVGDPWDDCIDAFRYGLYTYVSAPRPSSWQTSHDAVSPDPTIAMLQRRRADQRWAQLSVPARYLGRRSRD